MLRDAERLNVISAAMGKPIAELSPMARGGNSLVFRGLGEDGARFLVKQYLSPTADGRSRLEVESGALELFATHGISQTPRLIARIPEHDIGVHEYLEGEAADPHAVSDADIDAVLNFLLRLEQLGRALPEDAALPAAEACFSLGELGGNLSRRLDALLSISEEGPLFRDLRLFLQARLLPALEGLRAWAEVELSMLGRGAGTILPREERILSPSDVGLHNAIRRDDGTLAFVDFDYFGWDDPAKTGADFLLHPGMTLRETAKERFVTGLCQGLERHPLLEKRLPVAYALHAVKWCLILLNVFVPANAVRTRLAEKTAPRDELQSLRLMKAARMLDKAILAQREFPYRARK